ncbi:MAG: multi-sensor signal transduction histidine kinase [Acidimicrobiales bacterium]|nr:multi-sensor signal transduction histidine kinase [Acidimicrobiales bacterium]
MTTPSWRPPDVDAQLLQRVALTLNSTLDLPHVLGVLADLTVDLTSAASCSLLLLDGDVLRPGAASGVGRRDGAPGVADARPRKLTDRQREFLAAGQLLVNAAMAGDAPNQPLVAEHSGSARTVLVPLTAAGHACGLMDVRLRADRVLAPAELRALHAIGLCAGVAIRNARLDEVAQRQYRQSDAIRRLGTVLTEGTDADALVAKLNELLEEHDIRIVSMAFRDRRLARQFGGARPHPYERAHAGACLLPDGSLAVPMLLGTRVVGSMRVLPCDIGGDQRSFLEAVGSELADLARRTVLRRALEDAAREKAVIAERDRMAADLHDTASQIFVAVGLLARRQMEELPVDSPWRARVARLAELADQGKWEIEQAVRALSFVPATRRGLLPSLRALARSIESDSAISVTVESEGPTSLVGPRLERALFRVAHQAINNAWRHARCAFVRVSLTFDSAGVVLRVVDDGVGLGLRHVDEGVHVGINSMRRAMREVGGTLRVRNAPMRGLIVEARIEVGSR